MNVKKTAITVGVLVFLILAAFWALRIYIVFHQHLQSQTKSMGNILVLFVEDNSRMPANMDELYTMGYLVRDVDGVTWPGQTVIGRSTKFGSKPLNVAFQNLDRIQIGFDQASNDVPIRVDANETTKRMCEDFSKRIRDLLIKRQSTQPVVVPSPPENADRLEARAKQLKEEKKEKDDDDDDD